MLPIPRHCGIGGTNREVFRLEEPRRKHIVLVCKRSRNWIRTDTNSMKIANTFWTTLSNKQTIIWPFTVCVEYYFCLHGNPETQRNQNEPWPGFLAQKIWNFGQKRWKIVKLKNWRCWIFLKKWKIENGKMGYLGKMETRMAYCNKNSLNNGSFKGPIYCFLSDRWVPTQIPQSVARESSLPVASQ